MPNWPGFAQNFVRAIIGNANGPIDSTNPLIVTNGGGGVATEVDQGAAGVEEWLTKPNGNVAAGAADSGNPIKTGGKYNSAAPTLDDGDRGDTQFDVNANTKTTLGTLIKGENETLNRMMTMPSYSMGIAAAAATTTIKTGAGVMGGFIIPTLVAGGTVKIYDNTAGSGTVLLDTYTVPATITTGMGPHFVPWPVAFGTGLTVVATGAAMVVDILYL
jgi:hypothetical protein